VAVHCIAQQHAHHVSKTKTERDMKMKKLKSCVDHIWRKFSVTTTLKKECEASAIVIVCEKYFT
jgi:hypothetical protein